MRWGNAQVRNRGPIWGKSLEETHMDTQAVGGHLELILIVKGSGSVLLLLAIWGAGDRAH